jgi:hypothetical protein
MNYNPPKECKNPNCSNKVVGRVDKEYCTRGCKVKAKDKRKRERAKKGLPAIDLNGLYEYTQPNTGKPQRYTKGKIECIEAIKSAVTGKRPEEAIMVGNIIKYLWRYESKGGLEDIEKAEVYLKFLKEEVISNKKE